MEQKNIVNILITDDESYTRFFFKKIINKIYNFRIFEADNGNEALTLLGNQQIDLLILDINMPGLSGYEVLKDIRSIKNYQNLPVIIATTQDPDEEMSRFKALGINGFFSKLDILDSGKGKGQEEFLALIKKELKLS